MQLFAIHLYSFNYLKLIAGCLLLLPSAATSPLPALSLLSTCHATDVLDIYRVGIISVANDGCALSLSAFYAAVSLQSAIGIHKR